MSDDDDAALTLLTLDGDLEHAPDSGLDAQLAELRQQMLSYSALVRERLKEVRKLDAERGRLAAEMRASDGMPHMGRQHESAMFEVQREKAERRLQHARSREHEAAASRDQRKVELEFLRQDGAQLARECSAAEARVAELEEQYSVLTRELAESRAERDVVQEQLGGLRNRPRDKDITATAVQVRRSKGSALEKLYTLRDKLHAILYPNTSASHPPPKRIEPAYRKKGARRARKQQQQQQQRAAMPPLQPVKDEGAEQQEPVSSQQEPIRIPGPQPLPAAASSDGSGGDAAGEEPEPEPEQEQEQEQEHVEQQDEHAERDPEDAGGLGQERDDDNEDDGTFFLTAVSASAQPTSPDMVLDRLAELLMALDVPQDDPVLANLNAENAAPAIAKLRELLADAKL